MVDHVSALGSRVRRVVSVLVAVLLSLSVGARVTSPPPIADGVALVVSPHPDDETYAMAQTIAEQVLAGKRVVAVLVTDGDASLKVDWWVDRYGRDYDGDGDRDRWDFGLARRREYANAMSALGVRETVYLGGAASQGVEGFLDAEVDAESLSHVLASIARAEQVTDWFTIAPYATDRYMKGDYDDHADHRAVASAVTTAVEYTGGSVHSFKVYAYGLPKWMRTAPVRVRGSAEALARKRAAIEAFALIGGTSTPELYAAALTDTTEYLVPVDP